MDAIIKIESGLIAGKLENGTKIFLGIPYAAPPIGQLRWKPPLPAPAWPGLKPCLEFGLGCPQLESPTGHGIPWDETDEDCLSLNIWTPAQEVAGLYEHKDAKAYLYRFTRVPPTISGRKFGCHHGAEINYVFGNLDPSEGFEDKDRTLSDLIMDYWVHFSRQGDPNGKGLPHWPAYESRHRQIRIL